MRPIKLTISGLNSYIDKQTIDFKKLTSRGLFGIFGPTGCGKSTILDAIILSLYGHRVGRGIPRSTSEFINTALDHAVVGFQFELDTEKGPLLYHAQRKFKRTETGVSTHSARLEVMTISGEVIEVYDKTKDVTTIIESSLGLTRDDFMRSVVLPQGKFSEFLTLEGVKRRDMLERLLDLKTYGSALQGKIKARSEFVKSQSLKMEGEMKRYTTLTPEAVEDMKTELENARQLEEHWKAEKSKLEERSTKLEQLWQLLSQIEALKAELLKLESEKEKWEEETQKLKYAEAALVIWPVYSQYKTLTEQKETLEKQIGDLKIQSKTEKEAFNQIEEEWNRFEEVYSIQKEALSIKLSSLEKAMEHENEAMALKQERNALKKEYLSCKTEIEKTVALKAEKELEQKTLKETLDKAETFLKNNQTDTEKRQRIIEGKNIETALEHLNSQVKALKDKKVVLEKDMEAKQKSLSKSERERDDFSKQIQILKSEIQATQESIKFKESAQADIQVELEKKSIDIEAYQTKLSEKQQVIDRLKQLKREDETIENDRLTSKKQLLEAEKILNLAKGRRFDYWKDEVLEALSKELIEDSPCVLCGSMHHPEIFSRQVNRNAVKEKEVISGEQSWIDSEKNWTSARLKFESIEAKWKRQREDIAIEENRLERYAGFTLADFEDRKKSVEALRDQQKSWSDALKTLKKTLENKEIQLENVTKQEQSCMELSMKMEQEIIRLQLEIGHVLKQTKEKNDEQDEKKLAMSQLKSLYGYSDEETFISIYNAMLKKDLAVEEERQKLEAIKNQIENVRQALQKSEESATALKVKMERVTERGSGLKSRIATHEKEVASVSEGRPLQVVIDETVGRAKTLDAKKKTLKETLGKAQSQYSALAEKTSGLQGQLEQATKQWKNSLAELNGHFEKGLIHALDELVEHHIDQVEFLKRKDALKTYIDLSTKQVDRLEQLENQRQNQTLTKVQWESFKSELEHTRENYKEVSERRVTLQTKMKAIEDDLKSLEIISKKYAKYKYAMDLLQELSDLIRGNKFVEYVALSHLRYIALDASKRLMEITGHRYSLELDAKGNFIICDHYNGGVKRDTNTLSGGETFLTALSLSLALSSQIQLRGKTHLEFFFLDEGFGTLDQELLDTVMSSLEKLYHERLTVGIISHVDELKNRVPIKLTIEPAQAGVHGTKTKIEVT